MYWKYVRALLASFLLVIMISVSGCSESSTITRALGIDVPAADYVSGNFLFNYAIDGAWKLTTKIEGIACGTPGNPNKNNVTVEPSFSGRIEGLRFVAEANGQSNDGLREYVARINAGFNPSTGNIDGSISVILGGNGSSCDGSYDREFTLARIFPDPPPPDTTTGFDSW